MKYWLESFSNAFDFTWSLVVGESGGRLLIIGIIALIAIFIKDWRKEEPWKKGLIDTAWTIVATIPIFLVVLVGNALFFQPPKRHAEVEGILSRTNAVLSNAVVTISNLETNNRLLSDANASLRTQLDDRSKATNEVQSTRILAEANKMASKLESLTSQMQNATEDQKQLLATSAMNERDRLQKLAKDPIKSTPIGKIEGEVDISSTDEMIKKIRTKELAEKALAMTGGDSADQAVLSNCVPIVEYYIETFRKKLTEMAGDCGDQLIAGEFNAIELSRNEPNSDGIVFALERNKEWNFKIYFRNEAGPAYFSLFIVGGGIDLTCRFTADRFSYQLTGVPKEGALHGAGGYSELNKTILLPVLSWIISTQKDRYPLRNPPASIDKEAKK